MARQMITVPGVSEKVYIVRFKDVKGWWLVVEGDPTVNDWRSFLGCQKLHKHCKQVGETYYSGGSGADIVQTRIVENSFQNFRDEFQPVMVEVAPDDKE